VNKRETFVWQVGKIFFLFFFVYNCINQNARAIAETKSDFVKIKLKTKFVLHVAIAFIDRFETNTGALPRCEKKLVANFFRVYCYFQCVVIMDYY
jgi:hypothetical protein